jgi:hypothetical protein
MTERPRFRRSPRAAGLGQLAGLDELDGNAVELAVLRLRAPTEAVESLLAVEVEPLHEDPECLTDDRAVRDGLGQLLDGLVVTAAHE